MEPTGLRPASDLWCRLELLLLLWPRCSLRRLLTLKQACPQSFLDTSPKVWVLLKKLEYGVIVALNLTMIGSIKDLRLLLFFSISLQIKLIFNFLSQNTLFFDSQIKKLFVLRLSGLRLILISWVFFRHFRSISLIFIGFFPLWLDLLLHLLVF